MDFYIIYTYLEENDLKSRIGVRLHEASFPVVTNG